MLIILITLLGLPGFFIYQKQELCPHINHLYFQAPNFGILLQIQLKINPHIIVLVEGSKRIECKNTCLLQVKLLTSPLFHTHTLSLSLLTSVVCRFVLPSFVLSCLVYLVLLWIVLSCLVLSYYVSFLSFVSCFFSFFSFCIFYYLDTLKWFTKICYHIISILLWLLRHFTMIYEIMFIL